PCGLGGAPRERVLDDLELRALLEQPPAQRVDVGHRQTAVIGDEHRLGVLQPIGQLLDDLALVLFLHLISSGNDEARTGGGPKEESRAPTSVPTSAGLLPFRAAAWLRRFLVGQAVT